MNKNINTFIVVILILTPWFVFAWQDNFVLSGEGKLRFRYVEADQDEITGTFGEALKQGLSMKQRFDLSGDFFLVEYLTVGGTVRISNEDSKDMLGVPDFISTKAVAGWWFANLHKKPFDITIGSYETSFTPLTLMRWDQDDNPLGASGCGCQVAIGGISAESLEELKEDYRLEGAFAKIEGGIGDITLLFARSMIADEDTTYARHAYGGRARLILPYTRNFSTLMIGLTGLRAKDDIESVDQATYDPLQSDVIGVDINLPLFWKVSCIAEYARSIRDDNLSSNIDITHAANGIIAGLKITSSDILEANALYLQLDPYFSPLYRAISYSKNRQGFRCAIIYRKLPIFHQLLNISLYAKGLRDIKPTWNDAITEWHGSLAEYLIGNVAASLRISNNWRIESSYEYRNTQRTDDISTLSIETIDEQTHIASFSIAYEFTLQSRIMFKYRFIKNIDGTGQNDYDAHMPVMEFSFKF
jgi:hypothetical protein